MNAQYAANRYRTVSDHVATPEEILLRLLDGVVSFCDEAKQAIAAKDWAMKGKRLMQVVAILDELTAALDKNAAPEMAANLARIYGFARSRLLEANVTKNTKLVDEAVRAINPIRTAFRQAVAQQQAA